MEMIKLPEGLKVEINRKVWRGEIPANICPDHVKVKAEKLFKKQADAQKAQKRQSGRNSEPAKTQDKSEGGADE